MSHTTSSRQFNFGAGNPDPGVFPADELAAAAQRVIARLGKELARYPDQRGLPELRAVALDRFEHSHGSRPAVEDVVITNGATQGLQLCAQGFAQPGDSVIVEEFTYVGTIRVFKQLGLKLVAVPLDDDGMRVDALEEILEGMRQGGRTPKFLYTTATYQNPTGTTLPLARRRRLVELARQYQFPIVEDDTYADLSFEPLTEPAIYTLAERGAVMYISSFSKILGPGIRLGFFIAPESITSRLMPWKTDGGTSALSQMIVAEYFETHLWDHIEEGRNAVKEKRNVLLDALEVDFGPMGMTWTRPAGGLFLFVRLPDEVDRRRLFELAAARNIVCASGQAFHSLDKDVPYLRLSFGWIDKQDIPDGIRVLAECVREAMPAHAGSGVSSS